MLSPKIVKITPKEVIIKLSKEEFIHFTRPEYAELIVKSKKILASKSTSVAGEAFAVSTSYGFWSPYLPMEIYKGDDKTHKAILFTTSTKPLTAELGQVVWNKDITLKTAKIITFTKAKELLAYKRQREIEIAPFDNLTIKYQ